MAEPPAKRPKIVRGEDDYLPGNIVEIELRNFMTFDYLKCKPCSRLNLVIGPNGSGKSSIVCAIALGLGGDPSLLGRATNVGAYVKRGEENGYIKIFLRGDTEEEQIIITRKISTQNNSDWLFNGKVVPKKEILAVTQRFNIQVNNLTQFLPQDRVCEFAKLTPVQLLKETEKAVGDPQLPIQHDALIQKSHDLKIIERSVERNGETLDQLKALNAEQEKDVKRVRRREALLEKAKVMKKKLPWLKYDMKKAEYMKAKELENDAKNKLNEAAKTLNDLKEPIEKQKKDKVALEAKCKKVGSLISDNAKRRMEIMEKETQLEVQAQGKIKEIQDLRKQEAYRQQRILRAKEELAAAESELKDLTSYEPPTAEISKLRASILEIEDSERNMRQQKSEQERSLVQLKMSLHHCVDRLKDMESTKSKLLYALKHSGTEKIYEAYQWLQEHRSALNKEVYGPVLLEVNVSDRDHASYLEGHIPYYMWKSFITQDSGDRDFLVKNLRPFDVPVLNYVGKSGRHKEPLHIPEKLRALGIYSRLDQVFDAPDAVKEVMISQFGLEYSYIGTTETDQKADDVSKLGILDFWTPDNHYRWSRSRYGNHVSGSVEPVDRSRLLLCSSDAGEIERLRSRKKDLEDRISDLEESLKPLQSDIRQIEDEASKLRKRREEIVNTINHHNRKKQEMVNRVDQRKKKLASLQEEDDLDTIVNKLAEQAAGFNAERYKCALRVKELLAEAFSYKRSFADKHMASIEFDAKIREMEISLKEHEKFALQASLHLEYCKKEVEDHRRQLGAAKQQAESVTVITPELEKAFLEMPTTVEELEAAIQDNISQANSILFLNPNILAEYEDRQRQIEAMARKHEADKRELTRCLAEINALK
ncbi:hypothetical protein NL676_036674, partial [Syzygium grande]